MDFIKIDNRYRPIPLWAWNSKLDVNENKRQIKLMEQQGLGGYVMHARSGLSTEYMSEEWFDNIAVGIETAKSNGMKAWVYDENGWPSGFGSGYVNGLGLEFQLKYLRMEHGTKHTDTTICNCDGYHFYYDVNPYYVDVLDKATVNEFIDKIYKPYYEKYGNSFEGIFTDEPQISRDGIPWSFVIVDEYKKAYNEDVEDKLIQLFKPVGDYEDTRFKFWKLVTDLFSKNFMKPLYDWCDERGIKLTGHLVLEETMDVQLTTNGAVMPHYEYFHIPGVDWLGRNIFDCLTSHQVSSVAAQLGKKQVLSECFALCGHNVGFDELKRICEWQMVRGINLICPHLQGYSLAGVRKRDYPPAMYYQQPWWKDYPTFIEKISRIGMIMCEGKIEYDTLVIHPQSTAWICFDNGENKGLAEYDKSFIDTISTLEQKHILFHLGDETIMERHAFVDGNELVIGKQRYKKIVLPPHKRLFDNTEKLLDEFKRNGGIVTTAESLEINDVVNNTNITYNKRIFDEYDIYYFVNSTPDIQKASFNVGTNVLDTQTGKIMPFCGEYQFSAYESLMLIDYRRKTKNSFKIENNNVQHINVDGKWDIKSMTPNALTLDFCDYYFDGELVEKNGYVLNIQNRACAIGRPVEIRCEYFVSAEYIPEKLYLVCETTGIYDISINGTTVKNIPEGFFVDKSFEKIDVASYFLIGKNVISLKTLFKQSDETYSTLKKAYMFESEKNKLTYDMEIEPIYLVGDFSVNTPGTFETLEKNAVRYNGEFIVSKPVKQLSITNIEQQGFPFFVGELSVIKEFELKKGQYILSFSKKGVNSIEVLVNGISAGTSMWAPYKFDLSDYIYDGKNVIEIKLTNNLRNLLGPHHLEEGETFWAYPGSYFKESCVWNKYALEPWNEGYCFAEFGIKNID